MKKKAQKRKTEKRVKRKIPSTKIAVWIAIAVILALQIMISLLAYEKLPLKIITHWNAKGVADASMSRNYGLFFIPIFSFLICALLIWAPTLDPLKENIMKFETDYHTFIVMLDLFMLYLNGLSISLNLMYARGLSLSFNMIPMMVPAFSFLTYSIGILVGKTKRNWTIGIKTSWALSSDKVWDNIHRRASIALKIAAVISLTGVFLTKLAFLFIIVPLIAAMTFSCIDSYFEYRKGISGKKAKRKMSKKKIAKNNL